MKLLILFALTLVVLVGATPVDLDSLHKPRGHIWASNSNTDPVGQRSVAWISSCGSQIQSKVYLEQNIDIYCEARYLKTLVVSAVADTNLTSVLAGLKQHLAETEVDSPQDTKRPLTVTVDNAETKVKLVVKRPEAERMQISVNQSLAGIFEHRPRTAERVLSYTLFYDVSSHLYYVDRGLRMVHFHAELTSHPLDSRTASNAAKQTKELNELSQSIVHSKVSLAEFVPLSLLYTPVEKADSVFKFRCLLLLTPVASLWAVLFYSVCQHRATKSSLKV